MDASELYSTTVDPKNRRITKVALPDFKRAAGVFELLMGKKAELRRDFLEKNKGTVSTDALDI